MFIPLARPYFNFKEFSAINEALMSGWVAQGPMVQKFERELARRVDAKFAVATSSCTAALHIALVALGIGPGDEVIIPSFSFVATANAVEHCGASPVFADIAIDDYNLDASYVLSAITPKTKAVLAVHQAGLPADMESLLGLARRYDLILIEDGACALGAVYKGKPIGSFGGPCCFSFHPRKIITTGEGGAVVTNDFTLAEDLRRLRDHGLNHMADGSESLSVLGYNYRLTDIQGAIGFEQLKKLDYLLERRQEIAIRYGEMLASNPFIITPRSAAGLLHAYQSYIILLSQDSPIERDQLLGYLHLKGIAAKKAMSAIHMEPYYLRRYGQKSLPNAEYASSNGICLPIHPFLSEEEQIFIVETIASALGEKIGSLRLTMAAGVD